MTSLNYHVPKQYEQEIGLLIPELGQFLTPERFSKMQKVVQQRSRRVLTVFENTHHGHNVSAIIRSVDSFGFLDLFFIYSNPQMRFRPFDSIDRGASQWLFPKRFQSVASCAEILKANNYKIALISLPNFSRTGETYSQNLPSFSVSNLFEDQFHKFVGDEKVALIFGSELIGISQEWLPYADMYMHVDMFGFTESLNVSVCAGIILQSLRQCFEIRKAPLLLTEFEQKLVFEHWVSKDYCHASRYLKDRHPGLLPWFEFVKHGKFFETNRQP